MSNRQNRRDKNEQLQIHPLRPRRIPPNLGRYHAGDIDGVWGDEMKLTLKRKWFTDKSTIGELYIEDVYECFTLEDVYRAEGDKVYGETAIPNGRYIVVVDWSTHFKRFMPHLLNVPKAVSCLAQIGVETMCGKALKHILISSNNWNMR